MISNCHLKAHVDKPWTWISNKRALSSSNIKLHCKALSLDYATGGLKTVHMSNSSVHSENTEVLYFSVAEVLLKATNSSSAKQFTYILLSIILHRFKLLSASCAQPRFNTISKIALIRRPEDYEERKKVHVRTLAHLFTSYGQAQGNWKWAAELPTHDWVVPFQGIRLTIKR